MRSKTAQSILDKTPKEVKLFTKLYADLLIETDKSLDKYDNIVLFPEKVAKAKEAFARLGVPDLNREQHQQ